MNNYTFCIVEVNIGPVVQKPHGIEKMQLLGRESVYWITMNTDIEVTVNQCDKCLEYQQMQPQERALHFEIPCKPWEVVGVDVFMTDGKTLCVCCRLPQ